MLRTQRNARIHAAATAAVVLVGIWLGLPKREWAVIGLAIALVWMAECLNTALEAAVDLASPQQNPLARAAKDAGAAAVLIACIGIGVGRHIYSWTTAVAAAAGLVQQAMMDPSGGVDYL